MKDSSSATLHESLEEIAEALDRALGDTDITHIESDDELRERYPVQWACSQVNRLLHPPVTDLMRALKDKLAEGTPQSETKGGGTQGDFIAARIDYIEGRAKSGATAPNRDELAGFHDGWHARSQSSAVAAPDFVCLKEPRCKAPCGGRNCHVAPTTYRIVAPCRGAFTSSTGWACDCEHKHPLLCGALKPETPQSTVAATAHETAVNTPTGDLEHRLFRKITECAKLEAELRTLRSSTACSAHLGSADELDSIAEHELASHPSAARIARNIATMLRSPLSAIAAPTNRDAIIEECAAFLETRPLYERGDLANVIRRLKGR